MAAYTSTSPNLAHFPLSSSSRGTRQLPVPTLPPLSPPNHYTPRQQPLSTEQIFAQTHQFGTGDSYFSHTHSNPSSIPSSTASTPAPQSSGRPISPSPRRSTRATATKRTSISSLLSSPDNSSGNDSSAASSPTYQWSGHSSPTTAGTSRSNSVVNTPVNSNSTICYSPIDYGMPRRESVYGDHDEDGKLYSVSSSRKKGRSTPRAPVPADGTNRDEYDVLGRKKPKTPRTPMSWDPKDDILLKQLKEEQRLGWKEIATHFRGRTSHACQFRWRRLASGQLKYYQGHRRPPPVTTTSASFASEMASTATAPLSSSPKVLMNGLQHHHHHHHPSVSPSNSTPRAHHVLPNLPSPGEALPPMHPSLYHSQPWSPHHTGSLFQPTPLPSPNSYAPRFLGDDGIRGDWSEQEDSLLLNRKLSFDEVNVLLAQRTEQEIWDRMVKLREPQMAPRQHGMPLFPGDRREGCYDERMPGLGASVGYAVSR